MTEDFETLVVTETRDLSQSTSKSVVVPIVTSSIFGMEEAELDSEHNVPDRETGVLRRADNSVEHS
jgi:hypothetical protein